MLDVSESGAGTQTPGYEYRLYEIATTPKALLVMSSPAPPGPPADQNRSVADHSWGSLQLT